MTRWMVMVLLEVCLFSAQHSVFFFLNILFCNGCKALVHMKKLLPKKEQFQEGAGSFLETLKYLKTSS